MAQWSRADRTIFAKLVYYGPAFGGKTTNLEQLHRLTDSRQANSLLTIETADDRTLFFDLLPFDLGDILGHKVAMKLYTVPGQVRYDATRRVVLGGADGVIFVADSSTEREEQNRWSLQNLTMNMRAKGLDPNDVPVTYQCNKQDLQNAASPREVARWVRVDPSALFPATAIRGEGVLEAFMAASRSMLQRIVAMADERTRREIDLGRLGEQLDRAFAPHLERQARAAAGEQEVASDNEDSHTKIRFDSNEDVLENSIETAVTLGEKLTRESARASRLDREAESFRRLCDSLRNIGSANERESVIDMALRTAADVLEASAVSLVQQSSEGKVLLDRGLGGNEDPLLGFEEGRALLRRMLASGRPTVVNTLQSECPGPDATRHLEQLRAAVAVPLAAGYGRVLIAYAEGPDGRFDEHDVRFLGTLSGHLAMGLSKAELQAEIVRRRDQARGEVDSRSAELQRAFDALTDLDRMKERFLGNLAHEMSTPVTGLLSTAVYLRDYKVAAKERKVMLGSMVEAAEQVQALLGNLFRLVGRESEAEPLHIDQTTPQHLVDSAISLAGYGKIPCTSPTPVASLRVDREMIAQAMANLIDNAIRFSPAGSPVEIELEAQPLTRDDEQFDGLAISVLDRGPGVSEEARQRIFDAFEQGGDTLTAKPDRLGIGLHEARWIARRHGGLLECTPREGGGSVFRLVVPLEPLPAQREEEPAYV